MWNLSFLFGIDGLCSIIWPIESWHGSCGGMKMMDFHLGLTLLGCGQEAWELFLELKVDRGKPRGIHLGFNFVSSIFDL